jgi:uncharacterized protein (DUF1015 family)
MPSIAAGRFIRYANRTDLTDLVCPPYDVIDEAGRSELEAKSPYNFVRLILPREAAGDGPLDRYVRARDLVTTWTSEGVLSRDEEPSLFAVEQSFVDLITGQRRVRRGIQALLQLHDFAEGVILPHERTLSGPKADRLELMKAVQAHLSPIFVLYPDETSSVMSLVSHLFETPPTVTAEAAGATHRAWRITDPKLIASLEQRLGPKKGYIADGHHRYETALRFRELARQQGRRVEGTPLNYIPAFLCGMSDPGLVIFPTHRLVHSMKFEPAALFEKLQPFFDIRNVNQKLDTTDGRKAATAELAKSGAQSLSYLVVSTDGSSKLLSLKKDAPLDAVPTLPKLPALRSLDVAVLHGLVFEHVLGMSRESQEKQQHLRYVKDAGDAVAQVTRGDAQLAFLLNPTTMEQVRNVSEAGEVMPQKSTYFYPKIIDGLGIQLLEGEGV